MWDIKTPVDVVASAMDGRLHSQLVAMESRDCLVYGFIIEGNDTLDGVTVGYGMHAWAHERYDDLLLSVQCEGAKIVRSATVERVASRIAALYRWTAKDDHVSWRAPVKPSYTLNRMYGDTQYRDTVVGLMGLLPGCGEARANDLLDKWTVAEILDHEHGPERWGSVRGIGPKLTAAWLQVLMGDYRL